MGFKEFCDNFIESENAKEFARHEWCRKPRSEKEAAIKEALELPDEAIVEVRNFYGYKIVNSVKNLKKYHQHGFI